MHAVFSILLYENDIIFFPQLVERIGLDGEGVGPSSVPAPPPPPSSPQSQPLPVPSAQRDSRGIR